MHWALCEATKVANLFMGETCDGYVTDDDHPPYVPLTFLDVLDGNDTGMDGLGNKGHTHPHLCVP